MGDSLDGADFHPGDAGQWSTRHFFKKIAGPGFMYLYLSTAEKKRTA